LIFFVEINWSSYLRAIWKCPNQSDQTKDEFRTTAQRVWWMTKVFQDLAWESQFVVVLIRMVILDFSVKNAGVLLQRVPLNILMVNVQLVGLDVTFWQNMKMRITGCLSVENVWPVKLDLRCSQKSHCILEFANHAIMNLTLRTSMTTRYVLNVGSVPDTPKKQEN
jgi:hypothetical protein